MITVKVNFKCMPPHKKTHGRGADLIYHREELTRWLKENRSFLHHKKERNTCINSMWRTTRSGC